LLAQTARQKRTVTGVQQLVAELPVDSQCDPYFFVFFDML
jgi:hypothetical protein